MVSTYTTSLRLDKQGDGDNSGTWGTTLNTNVIDLVDQAVAGYTTISLGGTATVTVTANNGATDTARNAFIQLTGTITTNIALEIPAVEKGYFVKNDTSGSYAVTLKTNGANGSEAKQGMTTYFICDSATTTQATPAVNHATGIVQISAVPVTLTNKIINSTVTVGAGGTQLVSATLVSCTMSSSTISATTLNSCTFSKGTVSTTSLYVSGTSTFKDAVSVTKNAIGTITSVAGTAALALNLATSNHFKVVLTAATVSMGTPTNVTQGQCGVIYLIQDGTGDRVVTTSPVWQWKGGVTITPTASASSVDMLSYFVRHVSGSDILIDVAGAQDFKTG